MPNGEEVAPKVKDDPPIGFAPKRPVLAGWLVVVPNRPPLEVTEGVPKAEPAGLKAEETPKLKHDERFNEVIIKVLGNITSSQLLQF